MGALGTRSGPVCLCGWAEWLISSWTTVEWTSGSSFQRAAIIWTGLTGLLRGRLTKNTPYLCDSMMTLTSISRSFAFSHIPFSLLLLLLPLPLCFLLIMRQALQQIGPTRPNPAANTATPRPRGELLWQVLYGAIFLEFSDTFDSRKQIKTGKISL